MSAVVREVTVSSTFTKGEADAVFGAVVSIAANTVAAQEAADTASSSADGAVQASGEARAFSLASAGHAATASNAALSATASAAAAASTVNSIGDALSYKGVIDCSGNPNYPAADAGNFYKVSAAGKIGGASGATVEIGDSLICSQDSTASGTQAAVGAYWIILQANIDGAVVGPASSTSGNIPTFNGTGGKILQDSGVSPSGLIAKSIVTAAGDIIYATGSGAVTNLAKSTDGKVLTLVSGLPSWQAASSKWTALTGTFGRTSDSQMTVNSDVTSTIKAGMSIRYTVSSVLYYGMVTAASYANPNTTITIAGAPCSGTPTTIEYGLLPPLQWDIDVPGYWGDAADSALIQHDLLHKLQWRTAPAKMVKFIANTRTVDTTTSEKINVTINGSGVCSTSGGIAPAASFGNVQTAVDISTSNYSLVYGDTIEIDVQNVGVSKDSSDLSVTMVFVYV